MGGIVSSLVKGSIGERIGLRPGDEILSVNGRPLHDILDYRFETTGSRLRFGVLRNSELVSLSVRRNGPDPAADDLGIEFRNDLFDGVRRCRNRCPFCFVDQLPRGLRPSLYVKDDDYRLSFLGGNFVTLTNLTSQDWARIVRMRLSPLYVSVHATDEKERLSLLGKRDLPPVMRQLARLARNGIQVHAQVVLCPGINDGVALEKTVADLSSLFPAVKSVGVVPVGVTKFCKNSLVRIADQVLAKEIVDRICAWQSAFREAFDYPFVFAADEFYLLAGRPFPPYGAYADFPQTANGVGLAADFLKDLQRLKRRKIGVTPSFASATLVTGRAAASLLGRAAQAISHRHRIDVDVVPVENQFLGLTVTVAGLLTGADIISALRNRRLNDVIFVPSAALNQDGLLLDGLRVDDLAAALGRPVFAAGSAFEVEKALTGARLQASVEVLS